MKKRFRIQLVIALVVLICGVSLMGLVYIAFNKPETYNNPGIVVSSPSPVASPVQNAHVTTWSHTSPFHHSVQPTPSMYHYSGSSMPAPTMHGLYLTSSAQVHSIGGGGSHMATTSHSSSSRGIIYSTVSVAMPSTNFIAMSSEVTEPGTEEAPQMARLVSARTRRAPGPPDVTPPDDHQLVEHPIGDALWPLLLMALGYAVYQQTKKKTRVIASLSFLEAERYAGETVDSLRAITVEDIVLAMQPVVELEEECQVWLRFRTEDAGR